MNTRAYKNLSLEFFLLFLIIIFALITAIQFLGVSKGKIQVEHDGKSETVKYQYFRLPSFSASPQSVVIVVNALTSSGQDRVSPDWLLFAAKNNVTVLSLRFEHNEKDWDNQTSYQFPSSWSGTALLEILNQISKKHAIKTDRLSLVGYSSGAQFAIRFALWRPGLVRSVAAIGAEYYDEPQIYMPISFFISIGTDDTGRSEKANEFVETCKKIGIPVELDLVPGLQHTLTSEQIKKARNFIGVNLPKS